MDRKFSNQTFEYLNAAGVMGGQGKYEEINESSKDSRSGVMFNRRSYPQNDLSENLNED